MTKQNSLYFRNSLFYHIFDLASKLPEDKWCVSYYLFSLEPTIVPAKNIFNYNELKESYPKYNVTVWVVMISTLGDLRVDNPHLECTQVCAKGALSHLRLVLLSHFSRVRLCDPIDSSPPGSPVPGILQARTLEWVAISFSNAWKWKVKVKSLSCVRPSVTPWTAAFQAPLSMGFSRHEYWSGVPLPQAALNPNSFPVLWVCEYGDSTQLHRDIFMYFKFCSVFFPVKIYFTNQYFT